MKNIIILLISFIIFSCSSKDKKMLPIKTDFVIELSNILNKDSSEYVVVKNTLEYDSIQKICYKELSQPFFSSMFGEGEFEFSCISYFFQYSKRIINIRMNFSSITNPKITSLKTFYQKDRNKIDSMLKNEVPDTICIINMSIARYYQYYMGQRLEDSSLYDYFIPDTIKLKLGLPKDYQSALPILSDTNIFR